MENTEGPKNWQETILTLFPAQDAPLFTRIKESVDSSTFEWWTEKLVKYEAEKCLEIRKGFYGTPKEIMQELAQLINTYGEEIYVEQGYDGYVHIMSKKGV